MLSSFTTRFRKVIWFLIFTFSLYSMPNLELVFPYKISLFYSEASASEAQPPEPPSPLPQETASEQTTEKAEPSPIEPSPATASSSSETIDSLPSTLSFKVDDFTGAAHMSYPIVVPPARGGLAPGLSLTYTSSGGNGWLGVGWDIPIGYIQRRGPRKGVPKYNSLDIFELNLGGSSQELAPIGGDEYRLRIEGAYLKIKYYPSGNYWEVLDKTGNKMRFGGSGDSRIDRTVPSPAVTYRWSLDRVEDAKTNYMEITYQKPPDNPGQIYPEEIKYNGQLSGNLPHNHRVIFNLESTDRPDPIYNYRAGFKMLTRKRLSSIQVMTDANPVRKYQFNYLQNASSNPKSLLAGITLYGNDGVSTLPSITLTYQTHALGFESPASGWPNPSAWDSIHGNYIRNSNVSGTFTDVIDLNGDGLPDRVVYDRLTPQHKTWKVFFNDGSQFPGQTFEDGTNWPNPSAWDSIRGNYIRNSNTNGTFTDVIDLNGDGLPDRVVYDRLTSQYKTWKVFFNDGSQFPGQTFEDGTNWPNPSAWDLIRGNYIRNSNANGVFTDVVDLNGDGLPDRVVYDRTSPYNTWAVFFNNGSGFDPGVEWPNPSAWALVQGNYIRCTNAYGTYADLIDLNGDGLPDRVVYDKDSPYDTWTVYFNNGNGFEEGVGWPNPSAKDSVNGNYIRNSNEYGIFYDLVDLNGDGLPDRVVYSTRPPYDTWTVYFNNGTGFGPGEGVSWPNPSAWALIQGNYIRNTTSSTGYYTELIDLDGDGLPDRVVYDRESPYDTWAVYFNKGPVSDLLSKVHNGIGGEIEIAYTPSTLYDNRDSYGRHRLPYIVQTVSSYTQKDGRGNDYLYRYEYSGGFHDPLEVEFRGFKKVTAYQMANSTEYESKTETTFHQDYYRKGKIEAQILTSREGHTRQVENSWDTVDVWNTNTKFPRLTQTTSTITDNPGYSYAHQTTYAYDAYLNVSQEHKYGATTEETIRTYFAYTNCPTSNIFSKPTDIMVKNSSLHIVSRKWMDYDCNTGNLLKEEVCKSDNPASWCLNRDPNQNPLTSQNPMISYQYDTYKNLWKITDPRGYQTTITYDPTKTHVYQTTNALGHVTTTEYDPKTGNLNKLIPPHLQGTAHSITNTYDALGRKTREDRPDEGWTSYDYLNFGNPDTQYVKKRERIVGGPSVLDHDTRTYFDGMGRTYKTSSTGPYGNNIVTETSFDPLGRVQSNSHPRFCDANDQNCETRYDTYFTYDGLSRVVETAIPDDHDPSGYTYISATYQGLKKIVTNQRENSTAYTYDVYQRLKKVEDPYGTFTEYSYDTLGNLTQVRAAKDGSGNNLLGASITTTMTYDSLSKKRTMTDPDMGYWTYEYDKSGNLIKQTDPNNPTQGIVFNFDGLNRLTDKVYPTHPVTFTYDDPTVPYSKGKLTKVSDPSGGEVKEDRVLEFDLLQRVKISQKTIPGRSPVIFEKAYDSAGRVLSITYPGSKIYSYEYDVAGNLLYLKDNASQTNVVAHSNFTALGQPGQANFSNSVSTTYEYYPKTKRLQGLITQKPGTPAYQHLGYQYDPNGNITTLTDTKNNITHIYDYDDLDRLTSAVGTGTNDYTRSFAYDRIGNITNKSDVGSYSYGNYSVRPHAVQSAGPFTLTYDANGNMISKTDGGMATTIGWNYDNKPTSITKGSTTVSFTYDGNGQRVRKQSSVSGTTFYFGELYEVRGGVEIFHLFAGNKRVVSIRSDGKNQFYHSNHLGSASVITDQYGGWKERIEYFPFGSYREAIKNPSDPNFPDVNYTFTDQEEDDELGLYNFKARLYDPVLGRFISPDRLVQAPENPQTLNRYSYCLNNPLIYVDPSGEIFESIIAAIVSVVTSKAFLTATAYVVGGAALGAITSAATGGNIWQGALTGAISGAIFFGAGEIIGMAANVGQLTTVAERVAVHAVAGMFAGGTNSAITGGNIGLGILTGGIAGGLGMAVGYLNFIPKDFTSQLLARSLAGGIAGGIAAEIYGGKFGEGFALGAATAAAGFLFNETIHEALDKYQQYQIEQQEKFNKWMHERRYIEREIGGLKVLVPKSSANPFDRLTVKFEGGNFKMVIAGAGSAFPAKFLFMVPHPVPWSIGLTKVGFGYWFIWKGLPSIHFEQKY